MKNFVKLNKNEMKMIIGGDYTVLEEGAFSCAKAGAGGNTCGGDCSEGGVTGTCSDSSGMEPTRTCTPS